MAIIFVRALLKCLEGCELDMLDRLYDHIKLFIVTSYNRIGSFPVITTRIFPVKKNTSHLEPL